MSLTHLWAPPHVNVLCTSMWLIFVYQTSAVSLYLYFVVLIFRKTQKKFSGKLFAKPVFQFLCVKATNVFETCANSSLNVVFQYMFSKHLFSNRFKNKNTYRLCCYSIFFLAKTVLIVFENIKFFWVNFNDLSWVFWVFDKYSHLLRSFANNIDISYF